MDLIDEQDIFGLKVCQDRGEIAGALDHRAGGSAEADAELTGDNLGQRGLAEAGRAMQQHMVECLTATAGGRDEDGEVFARGSLADEFGERLWAEGRLGGVFFPARRGDGATILP